MQGHTLDQSAYHGQWVLVNFWATWCQPCRQEIPELIRLQHDEAGKLTIIGIAVSYSNPQSVTDFVRQHGMGYPIVLGNADMAAEFGGFMGLPASFLYGPDGRLMHRFEGPQTEASIEQAMGLSPH
jgi:thiol-disulfide isomerase/thioredoxin